MTMVNRFLIRFSFIALALFGLFIAGCKTTAPDGDPILTGKIRVANYQANNDVNNGGFASSFDVYLYPADGAVDSIPKALALGYGIVTPYITNLETGLKGEGRAYTLIIRKAGDKSSDVLKTTVTIHPEDKLTFVLYKYNGATLGYSLISDAPPSGANANLAYYRFLNTVNEDIIVRVGDPVTGDQSLTPSALSYMKVGDYKGFPTALDTTLTFYIVKPGAGAGGIDSVLGRLAGVSLEPGSYHTITWGGAVLQKKATKGAIKDDSNRVRILDDNQLGNDASFPVQQTMRFIFVNALIPTAYPNATIPDYQQLGIVLNADSKFNFTRMTPCSFGPKPVKGNQNEAQWVIPVSLPLSEAVKVAAYITDPATPNQRGRVVADYKVGKRSDIQSDKLVALVMGDTTYKTPLDSTRLHVAVPIPDNPVPSGKARLVIVNALANKAAAATANITFSVNGTLLPYPGSWSPRVFHPKPDEAEYLVDAGATKLSGTMKVSPTAEPLPDFNFTTDSGGIYLVVVCGTRLHTNSAYQPHIVVAKVNPKWPE